MINKIIYDYIAKNKRIVMPGVGALLKKEGEAKPTLTFVPYLQKDDGILKSLIAETYSISSEEASNVYDEFYKGIKHSIDSNGQYIIDKIGVLKIDDNKVFYLESLNSLSRNNIQETKIEELKQETISPLIHESEKTFNNPVVQEVKYAEDIAEDIKVKVPKQNIQIKQPQNKKPDFVLIIAIAAASIAILAMLYGYFFQDTPKTDVPITNTIELDSLNLNNN